MAARTTKKSSAARKKAQPYPNASTSAHPRSSTIDLSSLKRVAQAEVTQLTSSGPGGRLPPFNDWQCSAMDDTGEWLYCFGGTRPGPEHLDDVISNDFWRLNLQSGCWDELTSRLKERHRSPFKQGKGNDIPPRAGCAMVFFRHSNGTKHVLIYGGAVEDMGIPSADLYSIELDSLLFIHHLSVSNGLGRIEPSMAVVNSNASSYLCIFGGRGGHDFQRDNTSQSYCVMKLDEDQGIWVWVHKQKQAKLWDTETRSLQAMVFGSQGAAVSTKRGALVLLGKWECETDGSDDEGPKDLIPGPGAYINYVPERDEFQELRLQLRQPDFLPHAAFVSLRNARLVSQQDDHIFLATWYETETRDRYLNTEIFSYKLGERTDHLVCLDHKDTSWKLTKPSSDPTGVTLNLEWFVATGKRLILIGDVERDDKQEACWSVMVELKKS
ncbi:hypothetical protein BKA62DRAFT_693029 [Auriculariales sp. MPI-PUGE-AT-0066]|nr:hypothetical protein BKA62DRAFT_693029 [Auriculariales sp. MPI-PUGE-AT-0066]